MGYWTIKLNRESIITEKTLGDSGDSVTKFWGINSVRVSRHSLHADEMRFTMDGEEYDADSTFKYGDIIELWRDRISSSNGTLSGGTRWFVGLVTKVQRLGKAASEQINYTVSGPWYYFQRTIFEQKLQWPIEIRTATGIETIDDTTHVVLGLDTLNQFPTLQYGSQQIMTNVQLKIILDFVLSQNGPIFTYDFNEFSAVAAPTCEKRDIDCAEAIKAEARWFPDCVTWFDYTQDPPVFHITRRASMPQTVLQLSDTDGFNPDDQSSSVVKLSSAAITPRYDLQVPQVIIRYEQISKVNGVSLLAIANDVFPDTTPTNIDVFRATINLIGFNTRTQTLNWDSTLIGSNLALFHTLDFWKAKHHWLNKVTDLSVASVTTDVQPLAYALNKGAWHSWMRVNNSGPLVTMKEVNVTAVLNYTSENGSKPKDHTVVMRVKTTNGPPGPYTRTISSSVGETVPIGMAKWFYDILNVLQYDGELTIEQQEITTQRFIGTVINLSNGAAEWASMNALVQGVEEDIDNGITVVSFGVNRFLSPNELMDLLRVNERLVTSYSETAVQGQVDDANTIMPDDTAKDAPSSSAPDWTLVNILADHDGVTEPQLNLFRRNAEKEIDTTKPRVQMSLANLAPGQNSIPKGTILTLTPRFKVDCIQNADGTFTKVGCIYLCSETFPIPQ